ncbi:unnamed protein product [Lathyrus sativus]|nr:unnamed protein product [Lathyrus sativus]
MAVELMTGYNTAKTFTSIAEQNVVQEAASGLESVEKLIKLLSEARHKYQTSSSSSSFSPSNPNNNHNTSMEIERDCKAVVDIAVPKFKRVISLLEKEQDRSRSFQEKLLHRNKLNLLNEQSTTHKHKLLRTPIISLSPISPKPTFLLPQNDNPHC